MKEKYDSEEFYCPKLGHHLTFKYCRSENLGLPCARVSKCCSDKIPIPKFLYTYYSGAEVQQIFKGPGTKINSIIRVVQKVNKDDN
ncbi:MAG: hypothetical protein V3U02_13440 [Calditrichia bacterium]